MKIIRVKTMENVTKTHPRKNFIVPVLTAMKVCLEH